ncbi:lysylphosphatidylglycerol synthase transmembrane domain-containing protein [Marinitoga lauensis]|uniref:lysylphosphatidylglycerol synthase transmembrane domain-containing protein n=1 Tax=Marinitoga lauensis TaxID=2201189 RepID=UPI00140477B3|nr:lysylphosphatidylglycerol synthase transmembrane domain-containing protein [Marinitoga lauensis]
MKKKYNNIIGLISSIVIGLLVILFIEKFYKTSFLREIKKINVYDIISVFFIYFMGYIVDSLRYLIIIKQFGKKIRFFNLFYNNVMGLFFSSITPFAAGGQPYQIYHLNKHGLSTEHSTNIVVSRFITAMMLNLIIAFFSYKKVIHSLYGTTIESALINMGLIVSSTITILILLVFINSDIVIKILDFFKFKRIQKLKNKYLEWSKNLKESITFLWNEKFHIMILDILLNLVVLSLQAFSLFFLFTRYANLDNTFDNFLIVFGVMMLLNMVVYYIPTPGASGTIEASYQLIFSAILKIQNGVFYLSLGGGLQHIICKFFWCDA